MVRTLIAAIATVLLGCSAGFSQIGTGAPVPSPLGITSPIGMTTGSPVPPAGIPLACIMRSFDRYAVNAAAFA